MCTLTWWHETDGEGYHLFFSRDERRTRARECPPEMVEFEGEDVLAPRDGAHRGTWLAVNRSGESYALLNHYDFMVERPEPEEPLSRGMIPLWMAARRGEAPPGDLSRFRSFHLVKLSPGGVIRAWVWNGVECAEQRPEEWAPPMLTTSSFDSARVVAARRETYRSLLPLRGADDLACFHRSTSPLGPEYGVLMWREDSRTRSIIRVQVDRREVTMSYEPVRDSEGTGERDREPCTVVRFERRPDGVMSHDA